MKFEFEIDTQRVTDEVLQDLTLKLGEIVKARVANEVARVLLVHPQSLGNIPLGLGNIAMLQMSLFEQIKPQVKQVVEENIQRHVNALKFSKFDMTPPWCGPYQHNPFIQPPVFMTEPPPGWDALTWRRAQSAEWGGMPYTPQQQQRPTWQGPGAQSQFHSKFSTQPHSQAQFHPDVSGRHSKFQYPFEAAPSVNPTPTDPQQTSDSTKPKEY